MLSQPLSSAHATNVLMRQGERNGGGGARERERERARERDTGESRGTGEREEGLKRVGSEERG